MFPGRDGEFADNIIRAVDAADPAMAGKLMRNVQDIFDPPRALQKISGLRASNLMHYNNG